jgi:hypothetical protein
MISKDYNKIRTLIDEIIGIDTKSGEVLKLAIKNYFETKPIVVKLVETPKIKQVFTSSMHAEESKNALRKYTKKLKENISNLKEKGVFCGISS